MKKTNKLSLTKKDFSFVCPLDVDAMKAIDGGHFCDSCEKKVYDVSEFSTNQYQSLIENKKDICISFKKIATVSLALSLSACSNVKATPLLGKLVVKNPTKTSISCSTKIPKDNNTSKPFIKKKEETHLRTAGVPAPIKKSD
jgi:hypothetical protein